MILVWYIIFSDMMSVPSANILGIRSTIFASLGREFSYLRYPTSKDRLNCV